MPQKKPRPFQPSQNKKPSQRRSEEAEPGARGKRVRSGAQTAGTGKPPRSAAPGKAFKKFPKKSGEQTEVEQIGSIEQRRRRTSGSRSEQIAASHAASKTPGDEFPTDSPPRRRRGRGAASGPDWQAKHGGYRKPAISNDKPPRASRPREREEDANVSAASEQHTDKLQKVLAQAGLGSRRDMEAAIEAGRVSVNGQLAGIGTRVAPNDRILFDDRPIRKSKPNQLPRILLYHKPEAEIVSRDDPEGRFSVFDKLPRVRGGKWVSIGRLDYNTSGLLIFTTSGELANRLSHPRFEVEREYAVRIMGQLNGEQCKLLCQGVQLADGPAKFEWLRQEGGEGSNHWYRVMLREGRNREVRRMFEVMDVMVSRLMRVRFGIINLPSHLKRGALWEMDEEKVKSVLEWAGLAMAPSPIQQHPSPDRVQAKERRPVPRNPRAGRTQSRVRRGR